MISNVFSSLDLSQMTALALMVLLVLVTLAYLIAMARLLARQSAPYVIVSVVHAEDRPSILQLVVRNIGTGLAENIRFELSRPIPAQAFGLTEKDARGGKLMTSGPLIDGIAALGPGESRKLDWGQYGGLIAELGPEPVIATCRFRRNGKKMRPVRCPLDLASFAGTILVENAQAKAARELAAVAAHLRQLAEDVHALRAGVADRRRIVEETEG